MDRIRTPDGVGGDEAEDVFGGLDAVLKLSWPHHGTKVHLSQVSILCQLLITFLCTVQLECYLNT